MQTGHHRSIAIRSYVIFGLVVVVALVLVYRLVVVQLVRGSDFSRIADRQYSQSPSTIFDRGAIYFEDKDGKRISAATLESGYIVAINPTQITDAETVFAALSTTMSIDHAEFTAKVAKKDDPYEELAHRLPKETADAILALGLSGVTVHPEQWRSYPGGTLASHVLGFVGFIGDDRVGQYGVEQSYEDVLSRTESNLYVNFFAETFITMKDRLRSDGDRREGDVVLTIEPHVQNFLENEVSAIREKWHSKETGAIIINPKTGSIYAMVVSPNFNPNTYFEEKDSDVFRNPLIENVYEMGSTIKPLTIAAAIDAGSITAATTYYDNGKITLNESTIYNYDKKGRGRVPVQEILNQSLNTGTVFAMQKMGQEKFREYMYKYGLGEKTGIDLPGEVSGLTDNLESTRDLEYATASFGQGLAVTPIETVRALSALANGGYLVKPHIVSVIDYTPGLSVKRPPIDQGRVLKKETSEEITRMLVEVVDKALLGGTVALPHHRIAAKTGTAQIADETGGYSDDRFLHSFFGYFPAYDPEFLIFFYAIEPQGALYGSQTLTMPFMDTTEFLINYYEIPPDR